MTSPTSRTAVQTLFFWSARTSNASNDVALLTLRIGIAICFALLFGLKQSQADAIFPNHPAAIWPLAALAVAALLVAIGLFTRMAAGLSALGWTVALYSGLHGNLPWVSLPYRSALFIILFVAIAITGPGKFSINRPR